MTAWRSRPFEYQWLRLLMDDYADFQAVSRDALVFATRQARLEASPQQVDELMGALLRLPAWPDAPVALAELKRPKFRTGTRCRAEARDQKSS